MSSSFCLSGEKLTLRQALPISTLMPNLLATYSGNSGNAEGGMSHTHFELHLGRRILNPYSYLVAGQVVALEAAKKQHLAETIHNMCQPEDGAPAIDPDVCPTPTGQLPEIPKGLAGSF